MCVCFSLLVLILQNSLNDIFFDGWNWTIKCTNLEISFGPNFFKYFANSVSMIFAQLLAFATLAFAVSDALKLKNCGKSFFQVITRNVFLETLRKVINQNMTC